MTYDSEARRQNVITHGATAFGAKPPTWISWCNMRARCRNKNRPDYKYYGGRGIAVCKRWRSYAAFLSDMGERPDGMTLERKDVNKGYSPSNCEWATRKQQRINQRTRVHMVEFGGVKMVLKDWAKRVGISYGCLQSRRRRGWPIAQMLTEKPVIGRNQFGVPL